jgi:hypothetical protein
LQDEVLLDLIVVLIALLERDEGVDRLACQFIRNAYHGSFGNGAYGYCQHSTCSRQVH